MNKTVVIGLGNPILSDDSVGIKVVRVLRERLNGNCHIDTKEVYAGGLRLMDELVGYEKAIIIDAMVTGSAVPGTVSSVPLSGIQETKNIVCSHDTNLSTALKMGRLLGLSLPDKVIIWGIEAEDVETFSEYLTEDVEKAVHVAVEKIMSDLGFDKLVNQ
jgi:hydrogenase maturation protease